MTVLTTALLCDHAQTRGNVLFVAGGGISQIFRQEFPADLGLDFVFAYLLDPDDRPGACNFELTISHVGRETQTIAGAKLTGQATEDAQEAPSGPGRPVSETHIIPLHMVTIPVPGEYQIAITESGDHLITIPFWAIQMGSADEAPDK